MTLFTTLDSWMVIALTPFAVLTAGHIGFALAAYWVRGKPSSGANSATGSV